MLTSTKERQIKIFKACGLVRSGCRNALQAFLINNMIINFGKYKGCSIEYIFKKDKLYIEWLYNTTDSKIIKDCCYELLYVESNLSKIEEIILYALINAGYSETESKILIKKVK